MADSNFTPTNPFPWTPEEMRSIESDSMEAGLFAERAMAQLTARGALLTPELMDELEALWESERASRRVALVLLTKPFAFVRQRVKEDRAFALAVAEVFEYTKSAGFYKQLAEMLDQANLWAMFALLEREDMSELIEAAKAP